MDVPYYMFRSTGLSRYLLDGETGIMKKFKLSVLFFEAKLKISEKDIRHNVIYEFESNLVETGKS